MGSNFQQQARQRKLVYAALILVLFTAAWAWRRYSVDVQAAELAIREQSRGEVELSGAVVRLGLTGSRGLVTCLLWREAQDQQKKNQWNELEVTVRSVAKLQPHFITPWLFQSWNLAYNVSVESDRLNDKYFYITRGISLLAEGERQNRDNPDLRWSIGFYNQHKICQSDETNTLRSIFQLSYVPPNERDPARFWINRGGRQEVNMVEFEKFCKKHPQLVRRLKEGMRREVDLDQKRQFTCQTPAAVVRFLAENQRVPSVYEDIVPAPVGGWQEKPDRPRDLRNPDRFPVLAPPMRDPRTNEPRWVPPQHPFDRETLTAEKELRDEDDAYTVSGGWYAYAQEPIPDPGEMPGDTQEIEDRTHQRKPRYMMTVIFRQYPAQAARYSAERLQEEGWFDESGWEILDWFPDDRFSDGGPALVGAGRAWSLEAWRTAADLWRNHGERNHLLFASPQDEAIMIQQAEAFRKKFNLGEYASPPRLRPEQMDAETKQQLHAYTFLIELSRTRSVTNFLHHYYHSATEARPETVKARKLFDEAEVWRLRASPARALQKYENEGALKAWKEKVLLANKEYRRDQITQEQTLEIQFKYLDLVEEQNPVLKELRPQFLAALPPVAGGGAVPVGFLGFLAPKEWKPGVWISPLKTPLLAPLPFDGVDDEKVPLITQDAIDVIRQRHHLATPKGPPTGPPRPPTGAPRQPQPVPAN